MAWGGLVGRGLGQGSPYLTPLSFSDFILPSLGEELGLTGVMAIVLLYGADRRALAAHRADLP